MTYSMKSLCISTTMAAIFIHGSAYAASSAPQNNWYLGVTGDLTWLRHSDTGGGGNIDLGYRFNDFRIEGEAGYHGADGNNGYKNTHYFNYMGNLYYDFTKAIPASNSRWGIIPYVGGGVGYAQVHVGNGSFSHTFNHHDNDFAYQGLAGLTFTSTSMARLDWSIGYKYLGTDEDNLHANNLELGVRYHF